MVLWQNISDAQVSKVEEVFHIVENKPAKLEDQLAASENWCKGNIIEHVVFEHTVLVLKFSIL